MYWLDSELYLDKFQQAPEAPGDRIEPFRARIRPLWIDQLGEVAVHKVAVSHAWWVILLGDVAGGKMAKAQEITGSLDVTFLLRWEDG